MRGETGRESRRGVSRGARALTRIEDVSDTRKREREGASAVRRRCSDKGSKGRDGETTAQRNEAVAQQSENSPSDSRRRAAGEGRVRLILGASERAAAAVSVGIGTEREMEMERERARERGAAQEEDFSFFVFVSAPFHPLAMPQLFATHTRTHLHTHAHTHT